MTHRAKDRTSDGRLWAGLSLLAPCLLILAAAAGAAATQLGAELLALLRGTLWGKLLAAEAGLGAVAVGIALLTRRRWMIWAVVGMILAPWITSSAMTLSRAGALTVTFEYPYQQWSLLTAVFSELRAYQILGPLATAALGVGIGFGLLLPFRPVQAGAKEPRYALAVAAFAGSLALAAALAPLGLESLILGLVGSVPREPLRLAAALESVGTAELIQQIAILPVLGALAIGWQWRRLLRGRTTALVVATLCATGAVAFHLMADAQLRGSAHQLLAPPWKGRSDFQPLLRQRVALHPWAPRPSAIVVLGRKGPSPSFQRGDEFPAIAPDARRPALATLRAAAAGCSSVALVGVHPPPWPGPGQGWSSRVRRPLLATFQTPLWGMVLKLVARTTAASVCQGDRREVPIGVPPTHNFGDVLREIEAVERKGCIPVLAVCEAGGKAAGG